MLDDFLTIVVFPALAVGMMIGWCALVGWIADRVKRDI